MKRLASPSAHTWWTNHTFSSKSKVPAILTRELIQRREASQYLQQSVIPTMHFQPSLPRLPIPKLEDTHRRYLDAQKPLLTPDAYINCKEVTENFISYEGRALHAKLVELDNKNTHTSYISEPWYDMYLRYRGSIVLNHNPYILFNQDPTTSDQLIRATKAIHTALRFKRSLDENLLEPDVFHLNPKKSDTALFRKVTRLLPSRLSWYGAFLFKAYPLDMSQYSRLFNSTRIPGFDKDLLYTDKEAKHLLVIKNGHYFVFDVFGDDGRVLSMDAIYCNLKKICALSEKKSLTSIGVLTTEKRDCWASVRKELERDPSNAAGLKLIDGALFALCLDEMECQELDQINEAYLYGNASNRWFDKSFQLIVSKNAELGINLEHAWGDGVSIMRFINDIQQETSKFSYEPPKTSCADSVRKIDFNLTPSAASAIKSAEDNHLMATSRLRFNAEKVPIGKNFFKKQKVSPDSMFQLAIQMAYFRLKGTAAATYESCSTAAFRHGRTETIRPASVATVACCEAFEKSHPATTEEIVDLLQKQSEYHGKLTKEAAMGQGFDRHLFGLKHIAETEGKKVAFFHDPAYTNINHIILSTSTVFSPNVAVGGFAPVTHNGLGIGYMVNDDWSGCNVMSYPNSPSGSEFLELLIRSIHDIHSALSGKDIKA